MLACEEKDHQDSQRTETLPTESTPQNNYKQTKKWIGNPSWK